jgi:hypothetical protein
MSYIRNKSTERASGKTGDWFADEDKMFSDGIGMIEIY